MQKKVLVFIPEFPVLSETFIEREIDGLVTSRALDVVVVALSGKGDFRSKRSEKVTVYERLTISDSLSAISLFFKFPRRILSAWKLVGVKGTYLFLKGVGYSKVFSRHSPDIIYSHFLSEPSSIAMVVAIILDIPFAISAHARDVLEYPHLVKEKVRHAKFISFCNKNALERVTVLAEGEDTSNLKLVYHGIDPKTLVPKKIIAKKPSENFVFSVGRLEEKKGQRYLIEASEILIKKGFPHVVYIVGAGPLLDGLDDLILERGLSENVVLLGKMPFEEVTQYFQLADIFVQPSINAEGGDADGVPNTLIEAAMLKVPMVTTDAGSIRDFVNEGSAVMVKQRNAQELAMGIQKVLENEELREHITKNAYKKALEMFNIKRNVKRIEEMLLN